MNLKKLFTASVALAFATFVFAQADDFVQTIDDDMITVEGGLFSMGSKDYENNERPVHEVKINTFSILKTEVTQAEYKAITGKNYSHFKGDNRPVEEVSWYDAVVFCNKLSIKAGLKPCYKLKGSVNPDDWGEIPRVADSEDAKKEWNAILCDFSADGYRLPTEAEWEYAAKGGSVTDTFIYSGSDSITSVAWNADSVDGETHDVGMKAPNAIGLYDMSGNVWEWCWDWYGNYHISDSNNPRGAAEEVTGRRMRRGGSIASDAVFCRNANRASTSPDIRGVDLGFRVVRTAVSYVSSPSSEDVILEENVNINDIPEK